MTPKYALGQEVIITPVREQTVSLRDSALEPYAGQRGRVTDFYWVTMNNGSVVYIYTVQVGLGNEKIVLHEDELEPCLG